MSYGFIDWQKDRIISLVNPENHASIRVVERIGERLQGRIQHLGREMLCYGLDRATYLEEVAPAGRRLGSARQLDGGGPSSAVAMAGG